jgi:integrase
VSVLTLSELFSRIRHRVGFGVRAHKFRHTYATEYLRRGGEIDRLRRTLGHTTYVMVMRYVHFGQGRPGQGRGPAIAVLTGGTKSR